MSTRTIKLTTDMRTVLRVTRAISAERDLTRLLDLIVQSTSQLVGADRTTLFIVDEARRELWSKVAEGSGTISLPIGKGIAGAVAESGRTVNIPDAYRDDRFDPANDQRTGYRTHSILCMPMISHDGRTVGVIQALNKDGGLPFDSDDEHLLAALCSQGAICIDRNQLVERDMQRRELERDMTIARAIQQSLLPNELPAFSGWRLAHFQQPCDATGGDYHDVIVAGDGSWCDLIVGDVSGHGIGAALMMSSARAFLLGLYEQPYPSADRMSRLNRLLERDMADDTFMSAILVRLTNAGGASFVSAGHEPPFVYRAGADRFDTYEDTGALLGIIDDETYEEHAVSSLDQGDLMLLCTDGIFEAPHHETGEEWGLDRLYDCIRSYAPGGAEAVVKGITQAVEQHLGGPAQDDLTLLVAERTA